MNDLDTVFDDNWPKDHRSGVVAVVGRPNVGKSTLINAILGEKIAIVTPTPQTTRKRQLGIYTEERGQILFVDTPGLHDPLHKLGEYMVKIARTALRDADLILVLFDVSQQPTEADVAIAETVARLRGDTPVLLALNKADLLAGQQEAEHSAAYAALIPHENAALVSALKRSGVAELVADLLGRLPEGPRYYPADQISEVNMRAIAAEVIREKIILNTEEEIPHAAAVEVDSFQEYPDEDLNEISAIIYVERESQKGIVVGKGGSMIKRIGTQAREELEGMMDTQVYLDLRVKVLKNWRKNPDFMRRLGYGVSKKQK